MSFSSNKLSWHYYSNREASSAELIALSTKAIEQIIIRIDKKGRIVSRPVWNILSKIDRIKREWMDGIDFLNDATLILMRGLRPCQNPKLTFNEPLWVASLAHPHWLSGNNLNLVLYGSGEAGVQLRLIGGRSALVGVGSKIELDHSVSQSWAERIYSGHDRDNILHPLMTRCVPDT